MMSLTTINKLTDALPENIDYGDEDDDAIYSTQHAAVPRWDYRASAGQGIQIQEGPEERDCLLFQRDWLEGIASNGIDKLFALTIEGNSMAPTLLDGDTILVDRAQTKPRGDGIYLLNVDGELLVKRLQRSMADGTWTIISDNQLYPSEHGITPDLLDIEGRVRWIGRKI
jgi:phage repressor protein C with HTH and peptisase S24 domain